MKKFLKIFISLIILGALAYQFRFTLITFSEQLLPFLENLQTKVQEKFFPQAPCAEPIPYTLGTFDTQFNISKSYFLSALLDAKAIWEKASIPFSSWAKGCPEQKVFREKFGEVTPDTLVPITLKSEYLQIVIAGGAGQHSHFFAPFLNAAPVSKIIKK